MDLENNSSLKRQIQSHVTVSKNIWGSESSMKGKEMSINLYALVFLKSDICKSLL